jgi:hypothetical protein
MHVDGDRAATGRHHAPAMRPVALALAGLFGLAAVGAGALWVAQGMAGSPAASPEILAAESVRALGRGDATAAERALRRELDWGERRASAWCRLAFARFSRSGRFDAAVNQALLKSYEVGPFDTEAFAWRLQFVFEHWGQASPALREHAMREARAFHAQWPTRPAVEALIPQVRNPTGQFALRLAVRDAEPKTR